MSGSIYAETVSRSPRLNASVVLCTISTFPCDTALPLDAEVGERALAVPVEREPRDLPVAQVEQHGSLGTHLLQLQPARLPTGPAPLEREHAIVIELAVLLDLGVHILPDTHTASEPVRHPGHTSPDAGVGPIDDHPLDLRVRPLARRVVAAFPVGVDRAHAVRAV